MAESRETAKVLILGATSAIAHEVARRFAADEAGLFLCGRNRAELERCAQDLLARGAKPVEWTAFDAADGESVKTAVSTAFKKMPGLNTLLVAHSLLPRITRLADALDQTPEVMAVNVDSVMLAVLMAAERFKEGGGGTIAVISSVAGDRGRASNYLYGASKSALTTFLSGLRQELYRDGVRVLTIKPGFVDTPMTRDIGKNALFASARQVGEGIYKAMQSRNGVIYLPWFWRPIMFVVRAIPEAVFQRIRL